MSTPGLALAPAVLVILAPPTLAAAGDPCVPPCPPGAIVEEDGCNPGEPDTVNGGCFTDPPAFVPVEDGTVYCGVVGAVGGVADYDHFEHVATVPGRVRLEVSGTAEMNVLHIGANVDCQSFIITAWEVSAPCGTASVVTPEPLQPGDVGWWVLVTTGFDGVPCEADARYVATFTVLPVGCPAQGDVDGDGIVDFDDLLAVLGAFGPCPDPPGCPPADLDGDGVVDPDDLLTVVSGFGPCP